MKAITRRALLQTVGAGVCLAALPKPLATATDTSAAPTPKTLRPPNSAIYRFRIGDIEAAAILAGYMDSKPKPPPQATAEEYRAALEDEYVTNNLRLHFNVLLLQIGKENVLVDTGPGGKPKPPFDLVANLALLGLAPADITAVIITHAHFDHIGGLLDAEGRIVFHRAEHFCLPEEIDFWTAEKPDFSHFRMGEKAQASMIAGARRVFEKIQFTRISHDTRLPEGITSFLSPGHTPGHMTQKIESRGEALYHIADLAHHYAVQLPHPDWMAASDLDETLAAKTRRTVFTQLAATGSPVFGFHLPFPGVGHIRSRGTGFHWVPSSWDPAV